MPKSEVTRRISSANPPSCVSVQRIPIQEQPGCEAPGKAGRVQVELTDGLKRVTLLLQVPIMVHQRTPGAMNAWIWS